MNPPQSKCLGVFGLSLYTTEADLRGVMGKYGRVESVNVVIDQKVSFYSAMVVSWGTNTAFFLYSIVVCSCKQDAKA